MTMRLFAWALEQQAIPPDEKFVLLSMSESSDDDNIWRGNMEGICRFTNLDRDVVLVISERLVERGLLARVGSEIKLMAPIVEYSPEPSTYFKKKPIAKSVRDQVYWRDGYKCKKCESEHDLTIDHIHPESKGGTNKLDNLQTLCRLCNCRKGVKVAA